MCVCDVGIVLCACLPLSLYVYILCNNWNQFINPYQTHTTHKNRLAIRFDLMIKWHFYCGKNKQKQINWKLKLALVNMDANMGATSPCAHESPEVEEKLVNALKKRSRTFWSTLSSYQMSFRGKTRCWPLLNCGFWLESLQTIELKPPSCAAPTGETVVWESSSSISVPDLFI